MNNKVKKVIVIFFVLSCFWTILSAESKKSKKSSIDKKKLDTVAQNDKEVFQIVCTSFPQYDWVMNILGDEKNAAKKMKEMLANEPEIKPLIARGKIEEVCSKQAFTLSEKQKDAVKLALTNRVSIITGGPGTGKSTILEAATIAAGTLTSAMDGLTNYGIKKDDAHYKYFDIGSVVDVQPQFPVEIFAEGTVNEKM